MTRRLMDRFRRGDHEAVRELYDLYSRPVFAIALRSLGDRVLAEEVVQQTFVNAWRAASRFDPDLDPAPWLYAIARRVAVDVDRRERRHREGRREENDMAELPPSFEGLWWVGAGPGRGPLAVRRRPQSGGGRVPPGEAARGRAAWGDRHGGGGAVLRGPVGGVGGAGRRRWSAEGRTRGDRGDVLPTAHPFRS